MNPNSRTLRRGPKPWRFRRARRIAVIKALSGKALKKHKKARADRLSFIDLYSIGRPILMSERIALHDAVSRRGLDALYEVRRRR